MTVTLYHNPRCSTSRRALDLLREAGCEPRIVDYLKVGWTRPVLQSLLDAMAAGPRDLLRRKEPLAAGLDDAADDAILDAMIADPILVGRPIAAANGKACIGRPPERVLELL